MCKNPPGRAVSHQNVRDVQAKRVSRMQGCRRIAHDLVFERKNGQIRLLPQLQHDTVNTLADVRASKQCRERAPDIPVAARPDTTGKDTADVVVIGPQGHQRFQIAEFERA